jgi:hypothetical protein
MGWYLGKKGLQGLRLTGGFTVAELGSTAGRYDRCRAKRVPRLHPDLIQGSQDAQFADTCAAMCTPLMENFLLFVSSRRLMSRLFGGDVSGGLTVGVWNGIPYHPFTFHSHSHPDSLSLSLFLSLSLSLSL